MVQEQIIEKIKLKKKNGKKIVLCHGVFDIVHTGHLKYFKLAKQKGDILIVSVTSDQFVNKGPLRPINKLRDRVLFLKNLKDIDYVLESNSETSKKIIREIKPNFYCKGPDYKFKKFKDKNLKVEIDEVEKFRGKFIILDHVTKSSTKIISKNQIFQSHHQHLEYLEKIKKKNSLKKVISIINQLKSKKILILGELIIDKYNFVEAVGKSGKDPILVYKEISSEKYLGGTAHIGNVISSFSNSKLITHLGDHNSYEKYVKKNISKNLNYKFLKKKNSPTIIKQRYVDDYKKNKIIGFYDIQDKPLQQKEENRYLKILEKEIKLNDMIILADYGHGEITSKIRSKLQEKSDKLYLNAQINSFNYKSHSLSKYKKINTLCVNESELRNEMRDNFRDVSQLVKNLRKEIDFKNVVVTKGKAGAILVNNSGVYICPAFESKPMDTTGSGDIFFCLVSMMLNSKIDPDLALFIASIGAAYSTRIIGHQKYLTYNTLISELKNFLE